jgi:hypothetical protein
MRQSLVSSSETRRTPKRGAAAILSLPGTPLAFLLTGSSWLGLSFLLGIALIIGLVHGTPLPRWLRPLHVHGAMVGGILQVAIGAVLVSFARESDQKDAFSKPRSLLFMTWNGATAALLLGLGLGNMTIVGVAGLVLTAPLLSLSRTAWTHLGKAAGGGMHRIAFAALLGGLAAGITIAFRLTGGYYAHARLGHIHLIVLGCLSLSFIVALHQVIPHLLRTPPALVPMVRVALWVLPAGFGALLAGFLLSAVWLQLAVGWLLLASIALCIFHLVTIWLKAGSPGTAATDHLLMGSFFLLLATLAGLAMGANYLSDPPFLPIGSLHMVAYTHLAFIGFLMQIICGGLSYLVPELLSATRVQNDAKRDMYRAQLDQIMNRWRTIQLAGLSLGTIALSALASLTWNVPLGSSYVQSSLWIAAGLLLASLTLFAAKLGWAVGMRPS